jgi:hypothetical protein
MGFLRSLALGCSVAATHLLLASASHAVAVSWDIDPTQSSFTLAMPDQSVTLDGTTATVRVRNQSTANNGNNVWNVGNIAALDGFLATDYVDGSSIQFLSGQHSAVGVNSGNFRPNPAQFNPANTNASNPLGQFSGTGSAPAVFGARVRATVGLTVDAAFISFLDVSYDLGSTALPISGTSFAANSLSLGIDSTHVAFDGLSIIIVGQPIPDDPGALIENVFGTNTSGSASITSPNPVGAPLLRRLSIPVSLPLVLNLGDINLNASITGNIVAFATVPEPTTALLLGIGLAGMAAIGRKRNAH